MPKCFCDPRRAGEAGAKAAIKKKEDRRRWEALYVELAKRLRAEGKYLHHIAAILNERGHRTRMGKLFDRTHIHRFLNRD